MIEWATCRWACRTAPGDLILGKGRHLELGEVFLPPTRFANNESLGHQESVGSDAHAQAGVVVESPPATVCAARVFEISLPDAFEKQFFNGLLKGWQEDCLLLHIPQVT